MNDSRHPGLGVGEDAPRCLLAVVGHALAAPGQLRHLFPTSRIGKAGERRFETFVENQLGFIYRGITSPDIGIDGEIETLDRTGSSIARAVALIRAGFAGPLRVQQLAEVAGMSPSSFHEHFRVITSLTPIQFQKQLRLIEARRMMLTDGIGIGSAAHDVGYESVSQFTRDYGRLFGLPPPPPARHEGVEGADESSRLTGAVANP